MLKFFMGKNTPERQEYIIRNLRFEHDLVDSEEAGETQETIEEKAAESKSKGYAMKSEAA